MVQLVAMQPIQINLVKHCASVLFIFLQEVLLCVSATSVSSVIFRGACLAVSVKHAFLLKQKAASDYSKVIALSCFLKAEGPLPTGATDRCVRVKNRNLRWCGGWSCVGAKFFFFWLIRYILFRTVGEILVLCWVEWTELVWLFRFKLLTDPQEQIACYKWKCTWLTAT